MEDKIKEFLTVNPELNGYGYGDGDGYGSVYGSGDGDGDGSGYGSGDGSGYGDGDGYGSVYGDGDGSGDGSGYGSGDGSGDGDGDGDGDGYGYGLKSLNNKNIYMIDGVQTIITNLRKNVANGFIVNKDLTLTNCYVVKGENTFAHGETIKMALSSLQEKLLIKSPVSERVLKFKEKFKSFSKKYNAKEFYQWHFFLTGSCEMGRSSFVKNHNIDLNKDSLTVHEFIELTINSYGSEVIRQLKTQ